MDSYFPESLEVGEHSCGLLEALPQLHTAHLPVQLHAAAEDLLSLIRQLLLCLLSHAGCLHGNRNERFPATLWLARVS